MSPVPTQLPDPARLLVGCAFSLGAVVTAVVAPIVTARSVRASDKRKADQEKAMQDRKDEREDKMREQENLYTVATEYVEVCSSVPDRCD